MDCSYAKLGYSNGFAIEPEAPFVDDADGVFGMAIQPDGRVVLAGRQPTSQSLLTGRIHGGPAGAPQTPARRPRLVTLGPRYVGRGRGYAFGLVDARCSSATVRFVATPSKGGARVISTRPQRVSGAYGRQIVCAPLHGLHPGLAYSVRIESAAPRGPVGGDRTMKAVASRRSALAQDGCHR